MSQIQEYKEKYEEKELTTQEQILIDPLPNFLPQWTAKVLDGEDVKNIEYADRKRCLVGETHGMSKDYKRDKNILNKIFGYGTKCKFCDYMSFGIEEDKPNGVPNFTAIEATYDKEKFIEFKKVMFRHMQEEHPKKFKKLWINS